MPFVRNFFSIGLCERLGAPVFDKEDSTKRERERKKMKIRRPGWRKPAYLKSFSSASSWTFCCHPRSFRRFNYSERPTCSRNQKFHARRAALSFPTSLIQFDSLSPIYRAILSEFLGCIDTFSKLSLQFVIHLDRKNLTKGRK